MVPVEGWTEPVADPNDLEEATSSLICGSQTGCSSWPRLGTDTPLKWGAACSTPPLGNDWAHMTMTGIITAREQLLSIILEPGWPHSKDWSLGPARWHSRSLRQLHLSLMASVGFPRTYRVAGET